ISRGLRHPVGDRAAITGLPSVLDTSLKRRQRQYCHCGLSKRLPAMLQARFANYLRRRFNSPVAWMIAFGGLSSLHISVEGFKQAGWEGGLLGAVVGGGVGSTLGLLIGGVIRICAEQLERLVPRPD